MNTMRRGLGMVIGLLWLMMSDLVTAGDTALPPFGVFTMLEGQGIEVCEACLKALEALPSDLTGCERNYDPALGFEVGLFWEDVDALKHLTLLKQVMLFLMPIDSGRGVGRGLSNMYEGTIYENDEVFRRQIKGELKYDRHALAQTIVDIDNDGHPEPVTKYRNGACGDSELGPGSDTSQALVVFTADRKTIDQSKTDVLMQNSGKRAGHPAGNVGSQLYDIFKYKGRFYFDKWDNGLLERDTFAVYQTKGLRAQRLCKYRYERRYQANIEGWKP